MFDRVLTFSWRSPYCIETSPLTCYANQWNGFYMIGTSAMKELNTPLEALEDHKLFVNKAYKVLYFVVYARTLVQEIKYGHK